MRSKLRAVLVGTVVLVAACGGGGDDEEDVPATSTTDAATADPDPTEDDAAGDEAAEDATDDGAAEAEDEAQAETETETEGSDDEATSDVAALEASLLTLDDMPVGWTEAPELLDDDDDEDEGECSFDAGLEEGRRAQAAFKAGESGPFVLHALGAFSDEAEAETFMGDFAAFAERCQSYEEAGITTSMAPMSFTELGDESLAYRMAIDDPAAVPVELDVVLWRSGDRASILAVFSAGGPPDSVLTQELADVAAART